MAQRMNASLTTQARLVSRHSIDALCHFNIYRPTAGRVGKQPDVRRARFRDNDLAGNRIPGAIEGVGSLAIAIDNIGTYFGALQFRYFGTRLLIEDNSIRSRSTNTLNGTVGYKITPTFRIQLEGFNLTDRKNSAIGHL